MDNLMTRGLYPMAWSPLAGGELFTGDSEKVLNVKKTLLAIGEKYGEKRLDTLAFAFLTSHPGKILPIVGSGKIERIQNAIDALKIKFTSEEWLSVYKASIGKGLA